MSVSNSPVSPPKSNWLLPFILGVVVVAAGFFRIEDRSILQLPAIAASAMAAVNVEPESEYEDTGGEAEEGFVPVSNASAVPRNRTRRILRERAIASRSALAPATNSAVSAVQDIVGGDNPLTAEAIQDAFSPTDAAAAPLLGSPALAPISNRLFAANIPGGSTPPGGGGSTGGGGTDGGVPGGGTGGGTGGGGGIIVTPVPEPASWIMLLTGFALIGWALRRRQRALRFGLTDAHQSPTLVRV